MVNSSRQPTAEAAAPTSRGPRPIGNERDAAEAFGEGTEMYLWALEFLRRPTSPAVLVTPRAALSIAADTVAASSRELLGAPPQPVRLVIEIELVAPKSRE